MSGKPIHRNEIERLVAARRSLLRHVAVLTGLSERKLSLGGGPADHWPALAQRLHPELTRITRDIERLNSQRCSQEIGEFRRALDTGELLSPELREWWLSCY